jgi:thioredoxin reductase
MTDGTEVIVVGGGAAGLSAALVLGRARRRTLVVDDGAPRNAPSPEAHSLFTRDGTPPSELLRIARSQLEPYTTVRLCQGRAVSAEPVDQGFLVQLADGTRHHTRRILLATGVCDELPDIDGLRERWGRSVLHCPYCHGFEVRDEPVALLASGAQAMDMGPLLLQWSRDLVVVSNGPCGLTDEERAKLARRGVEVIETPIARLEGEGDALERVVFTDGRTESRGALFVRPAQTVRGEIVAQLGCELTETGLIRIDAECRTSVPRVFAAGDASSPMQQLVAAAAAGALAAGMINRDLVREDLAGG